MAEIKSSADNSNSYNNAVYINSFRDMNLWINSTGFRTHGLRCRALSFSNDMRIGEDFLVNTRLNRHDRESEISSANYFSDSGIVMLSMLGYEHQSQKREVTLPESVALKMEIKEAFVRRRSSRNYTGNSLKLDFLATILRYAGGVTCKTVVDRVNKKQATLKFRATPSAGGLYPIEIYCAVLNVNDLEKGIYRYDPLKDKLIYTCGESEVDKLLKCFVAPDEVISISQANVVFLLVGQPWRSMRKYGNRGMRYLFIEAGSIAENINLTTAALGYGSVECAGIYDDEVHEVLTLDGLYQTLIHTVVVGYPG